MHSFRGFIDKHWRSPGALAIELDLPVARVRHWQQRDQIPDSYWLEVARAASHVTRESQDDLLRHFAIIAEAKRLGKNGKG